MVEFDAQIQAPATTPGAFVLVPDEVVTSLGGGKRIPVRATFDGIAYTGSIVEMGAGPCLGVLKSIRKRLGKSDGDVVTVTVERDETDRTVDTPADLAAALDAAGAHDAFEKLSYSLRREHIKAINSAKRPETRQRRIAKAVAVVRQD